MFLQCFCKKIFFDSFDVGYKMKLICQHSILNSTADHQDWELI